MGVGFWASPAGPGVGDLGDFSGKGYRYKIVLLLNLLPVRALGRATVAAAAASARGTALDSVLTGTGSPLVQVQAGSRERTGSQSESESRWRSESVDHDGYGTNLTKRARSSTGKTSWKDEYAIREGKSEVCVCSFCRISLTFKNFGKHLEQQHGIYKPGSRAPVGAPSPPPADVEFTGDRDDKLDLTRPDANGWGVGSRNATTLLTLLVSFILFSVNSLSSIFTGEVSTCFRGYEVAWSRGRVVVCT